RPFTLPDAYTTAPVTVNLALSTTDTLYLQQGANLLRLNDPDSIAVLLTSFTLQGTKMIGATRDGRIVGIRGQQYYVVAPGDKQQNFMRIPVESKPRPPLFLSYDPKGRLWGGPHFGQTVFVHDLKSDETTNTQVVTQRGGEVYDVAFANDHAYM